ncbi:transporter substrate-binding domain-containing protein [Tardiphaga sp. 709]|uniref:transporter substrate-binding domain-containing protein n=1 Tax=Tardiphaga sp. 709 TaxID=3076039 RepID=UPI0028EBFAA3|nr:transporter substrate-binding domain-containing protein [Tardiphaga sp. 709]WNV09860.1 transporter substrate-binding domain-containing protein [Tardiphaga sp. 709]
MIRITAAWLAACLLFAAPLQAQTPAPAPSPSRLDDIIARGTLRVGLTGDYMPFSAFDPATTSFKGFDVEMAESLGKALGVKVDYVKTSWPKLSADFAADQFDMVMGGVSITLDRQKKGVFSIPIMREGKTPIARCADTGKFGTLAEIDRPGVKVIVNPGGTNERFARTHIKSAEITVFNDNTRIFDEIAQGRADLMMTDASETRYQQKLHHGVLCAVHPDTPFDFAEKAYWLQRDVALKAFVDQWLHIMQEDGSFRATVNRWFE